jgi:hypothetical protein
MLKQQAEVECNSRVIVRADRDAPQSAAGFWQVADWAAVGCQVEQVVSHQLDGECDGDTVRGQNGLAQMLVKLRHVQQVTADEAVKQVQTEFVLWRHGQQFAVHSGIVQHNPAVICSVLLLVYF